MVIGHTRGLGLFLFDYFMAAGHEVHGRSRSEGWDISKPEIRSEIIESSLNFNIVVISARAGFAQSEFLFELHKVWKEKKHHQTIFTIGSKASVNYQTRLDSALIYDYQKLSLDQMAEALSLYAPIRLCHLNLDYLETPSILRKEELKNIPKIDLKFVANYIEFILWLPSHISITKTNIWAR